MISRRKVRFVRALLRGQVAVCNQNGDFQLIGKEPKASLPNKQVLQLASDGVVRIKGRECVASDLAANWVKRQMLNIDQFSNQHRVIKLTNDHVPQNLKEGVLSQLAIGRKGVPAFMQQHHLEAASRFQRLVETAQMRQRTTMSYDPTRASTKSGDVAGGGIDLSDSAIDAREALNACLKALPSDCAGIVMDVCGLQKGLQLIETERRWPRRSAKLILRVGLEQVANHFGLMPVATGVSNSKSLHWMEPDARASSF